MSGSRALLLAAAGAFLLACCAGLAGAVRLVVPDAGAWLPPFEMLRPLHETLALGGLLSGAAGLVLRVMSDAGGKPAGAPVACVMIAFATLGPLAVLFHLGSGREYFAWPAAANALLGLAFALILLEIARAWRLLCDRSPEGLWLIGFGAVFVLASAIESALWILPSVSGDVVRDLSVQWHSIDTLFAGLNAFLYGCGVLIVSGKPKPLRSAPLFAIAAIGVLFTFAHHHYISPQPMIFKVLALGASMLAVMSFVRRWPAFAAKQPPAHERAPDDGLWRSVEGWTLVSVASGVLFAIPQVNLLVHGTNLIVIHAMGSMIGVGVFIVVAGGLRLAPRAAATDWARANWGMRLVNGALIGLWVSLGADGLIEGVGRTHAEYFAYRELRDVALIGFPVFGTALFAGIALMSVTLASAYVRAPAGAAAAPAEPRDTGELV
ncbi:MAG: hypothetical protein FD124_911 [Alphaproteobacteria bacterium]|nr:MAG: hypothetical protein FD160_1390 [Caulobacteraceae bacterium]TPW07740.1 MAG: hypothetical protein FD124_911 [Alphaproteobacteria bacterium]